MGVSHYRSQLTNVDFPLCSACLDRIKQENIKSIQIVSFRYRGLTKDKNVGYVLERLIGAMTIQQKMDALKEELTPNNEGEDEEIPESDLDGLSVEEVLFISYLNYSYKRKKIISCSRSNRYVFLWQLLKDKSLTSRMSV